MALTLRHSQKGNITGHGIQMWSVETGKKIWAAEVPGQENGLLRFSSDGSRVALSGRVIKDSAGAVKVWNAASGQQQMEFTLERVVHIGSIAFSPDGKTLAATIHRPALYRSDTREEKAEIKLFDIETGKANQTIMAFEGHATNLIYSADGSTLVAVLNHSIQLNVQNVEVVFWDSSDYSIKERVPMGKIFIHKFALSPDATKAALLGAKLDPEKEQPTILTLWNVPNQSFQRTSLPDNRKERIDYMKFTPDSNRLVVAGTIFKTKQAEVWALSAATGDVLGQLNADNAFGETKYAAPLAALTHDGKAIALLNAQMKHIELRSLEDGTLIRAIE